jgi:hypothetical protein
LILILGPGSIAIDTLLLRSVAGHIKS